jgi:hypothetical protein
MRCITGKRVSVMMRRKMTLEILSHCQMPRAPRSNSKKKRIKSKSS